MRTPHPLLRFVSFVAVVTAASSGIFCVEPGSIGSETGGAGGDTASSTGGAPPATSGPSSGGGPTSSSTGTSSMFDAGPCVPACSSGVLTLCDAHGNPETPVTCSPAAACDAVQGTCLSGATPYGRLSVGTAVVCAIDDARNLWCWGSNASLLASDPHEMLPVATPIPGVSLVRQVSVGGGQQIVLQDDGSVMGWGLGDSGELGMEGTSGAAGVPVTLPELAGAVEVGAAARCSCARRPDGSVVCMGATGAGCLGDGAAMDGAHPVPVTIPGVVHAVQIAVGTYGTPSCAREVGGLVVCWTQSFAPVTLAAPIDVVDIAVGPGGVYLRSPSQGLLWAGLTADGSNFLPAAAYAGSPSVTAMAAGNGLVVVQGDGTVAWASLAPSNDPPLAPLSMAPAGTVAEISAGAGATYAATLQCLRLSGVSLASSVYCWGDDAFGALGAGAPDDDRTPVAVVGASGVASITASQTSTTILGGGTAAYLGSSTAYAPAAQTSPATLTLLGANNAVVRSDDLSGNAYAVKAGASGIDLVVEGALLPNARLLLSGFTDYVDVLPFNAFDVGLRAGGEIVVYADQAVSNQCGIFGNGTTTAAAHQIVAVPGVTGVTALAAYDDDYVPCPAHVCALASGQVICWGGNFSGEVGNGTSSNTPVTTPSPVSVPGETGFSSVAVGAAFSCAVATSGKVYCWGSSTRGQLGDGSTNGSPSPVQVSGIGNALGVTARYAHACAWLSDGSVSCWGANDTGQVGNGTFDDATTPYHVPGLSTATRVAAGSAHTVALLSDGSVACWGSSYFGQCGGISGMFTTPLMVLSLP